VNPSALQIPLSEEDARRLRAGEFVLLSGLIVTGRDRVHKYLVEERPRREDIPFDLAGSVLYHCGPVMQKTDGSYAVISAGPTTSMRVEMYAETVIREYGFRAIMGKGGMGRKTLQALKDVGCVYLHTIGGAAVYLADRVRETVGVWKLEEFGSAEAMWCFSVKDFPAIVTMDSLGNDLHREVEAMSNEKFRELIAK
jgi:tartrate/fumarate subfamily iron-sulfur-dependent hydro-lyase beta chain